jgi:hypothetical protein
MSETISGGQPHGRHRHAKRRYATNCPRSWPISIVAVTAAFGVGLVKLVSTFDRPYSHYGDQAVLALRVRDAMQFHAQLGPYSRFAWSHPGPALFYLLAPVYSLAGTNPRSLFVGSLLVNAACVVAAIGVVRRIAGEGMARWAMMIVGLTLVVMGVAAVETFWNPNLEAPAVLLTMTLAAAACSGSGVSLVWMTVAGTYAVQTDVGTSLLVGAVGVVGVVGWAVYAVKRGRALGRSERRRLPGIALAVLGLAALVTAWVPPLMQQATGHPGNLSAIFDFFTAPAGKYGDTHSLRQAWHVAANSMTAVPWGNVPSTASMLHASVGRQVTLVLSLAVAAGSMGWAGWRQLGFAFGLATTSFVGVVVSVVSIGHIVGSIFPYLTDWAGLITVPAWTALGILIADEVRRRSNPEPVRPWLRRGALRAAAAAAVVPVVLLAWQLGHGSGLVNSAGDEEVPKLGVFAEHQLRLDLAKDVLVVMGNADRWPDASGLMLQLTHDGYHPTVTKQWEFVFTAVDVSGRTDQPQLVLTDAATGTPLGKNGSSLTYVGSGGVDSTLTYTAASTTPVAPTSPSAPRH